MQREISSDQNKVINEMMPSKVSQILHFKMTTNLFNIIPQTKRISLTVTAELL